MLAGRLRERRNIGMEMLLIGSIIPTTASHFNEESTQVPASGPAHFPGAGDAQDQGLHAQLQSPVRLAKKHISARACHYKAPRLPYSSADQDAMSVSVFRVRRNSWRRTQTLLGRGQKETTADNKCVRSVKSCKHTNPASNCKSWNATVAHMPSLHAFPFLCSL